ncbi:MAG TPA: hypothetical protein VN541_00980, partial [Tepidisphaeraceae bacterium]|nr:hypothetical protein [Tepidisphaeraceae bacterium]
MRKTSGARPAGSGFALRGHPTQRRRRGWIERAGCYVAEELEARVLLTGILRSSIPASIDPNTATQALFVPGVTTSSLTRSAASPRATYYRFSVEETADPTVTFATSPPKIGTAPADAALALYDADGNLLQMADADTPGTVTESLSSQLQSRQPYIIGVFALTLLGSSSFNFTVNSGQQRVNSTIAIDPSTGTADFLAGSGQDTFTAPADVNYFPLNFLNGGTSGTLTLNAAGPDTQVCAGIFRQDASSGQWQQVSGSSGAAVSLNAVPIGGRELTDSPFMLAVAPLNLNTAPQPYSIHVAASLLTPPTVDPLTAANLGPLAPTSPGVADLPTTATFPADGAQLFSTIALTSGPLALTANKSASLIVPPTAVSVYDASGQSLLGAFSAGAATTGTFPLNATAGTEYLIRVGSLPGGAGGSCPIDINQTYVPTALS